MHREMNNKTLREKYGDITKSDVYTYPTHFYSPKDDFTLNIQNWLTYFSKYENVSDLLFLEIGTGHGRSAVWLLDNILTGTNSKIITIDILNKRSYTPGQLPFDFGDELTLYVDENLEPYIKNNKCEFFEVDSKLFFKKLLGNRLNSKFIENDANENIFDFIYLDGCHEPDYVMYESSLCFDLLKPGGRILFDDYGWGNCKFGIESFLKCYEKKINLLHKGWQVLIEKK